MDDSEKAYERISKILESIVKEAPIQLKDYHPKDSNPSLLHYAKSRALLHLYLKVSFGLEDFNKRETYLTDKGGDGGIDAYYIDKTNKIIYVIQSKFRESHKNYTNKGITYTELFSMDVDRVLEGKKTDDNGVKYNEKITEVFQADLEKNATTEFKTKIVIIGSSTLIPDVNLKKILGNHSFEQITTERIASDLIFPLLTGSYNYDTSVELKINLELSTNTTHLNYDVREVTNHCKIKLLFVPTREIGKMISRYRNSILKFNPRNFLELAKNDVNKDIYNSLKNKNGNLFSVLNNGITIVSTKADIGKAFGSEGLGQAILTNPQLINGGQTAYTLSRIYDECKVTNDFEVFNGKEVLLRVIEVDEHNADNTKLIEEISKASNSQSKIEEADRRANDPLQVDLQDLFFRRHGFYYERKKGEFADGIKNNLIHQSQIFEREKIVSIALATNFRADQARGSNKKYFKKSLFDALVKLEDVDKYAYGYQILNALTRTAKAKPKMKNDIYKTTKFGQALRYGKFSILSVLINQGIKQEVDSALENILFQWKAFEDWASNLDSNNKYKTDGKLDFANYYKGSTLNEDLKNYKFSSI